MRQFWRLVSEVGDLKMSFPMSQLLASELELALYPNGSPGAFDFNEIEQIQQDLAQSVGADFARLDHWKWQTEFNDDQLNKFITIFGKYKLTAPLASRISRSDSKMLDRMIYGICAARSFRNHELGFLPIVAKTIDGNEIEQLRSTLCRFSA